MLRDLTSSLQNQLGEGIVPTVDLSWIQPLLTTLVTAVAIMTCLMVIYGIYSVIRHHQVTRATLAMQKDIQRIRELMEQGSTPPPQHSVAIERPVATGTTDSPSADTAI